MKKNTTRYEEVPLSKIKVGVRRRQNLGDVERLASSIKHIGLAHPIRLDADYKLLCGQRRLEAFRLLNQKTIPANIFTRAVSEEDLRALELAENSHRKDFEDFERTLDLVKYGETVAAKLREEAQGDLLAHSGPPDSDRAVVARMQDEGMKISRASYQRKKKRVEEVERDPSLMDKSQGAALKAADEREGKQDIRKVVLHSAPLSEETKLRINILIHKHGYHDEHSVIEFAIETLYTIVTKTPEPPKSVRREWKGPMLKPSERRGGR